MPGPFRTLGLGILILGLSTLPAPVAAQSWQWGAQVGAARSWLGGGGDDWTSKDGSEMGALVRRDLTPHLALQIDAAYWSRGAEIENTQALEGRGGGRKLDFGHLEFSVLGVLKRQILASGVGAYLAAGPTLSQRVTCRVRDPDLFRFVGRPDVEEMDCDAREWEREGLDTFHRTHLLLTGAAGVTFRPGGESAPEIFLDLRFASAVTDLGDDTSEKLRSLGLSLGAVWPW